MSLQVCGNRLMIKPDPVEMEHQVKGTNLKILIGTNERAERVATHTGVVEQIGPAAWYDYPEEFRGWCKVGDHVVFARHAGKFVIDPETEQESLIINDNDIQVVIKKGKKNGR